MEPGSRLRFANCFIIEFLAKFGRWLRAALFCARKSLARLNIHKHAVIFDPHCESRLMKPRIELVLAGAHVELPAMPGASQNAACELPFAERAALMRADAVHRVERAIDVE